MIFSRSTQIDNGLGAWKEKENEKEKEKEK